MCVCVCGVRVAPVQVLSIPMSERQELISFVAQECEYVVSG